MQTSYSVNMEKGREGYIQDGHHVDGDSVIIEDNTDLRCGIAVAFGAEDNCVLKIASAADRLSGILIHSQKEQSRCPNEPAIKNGESYTSVTQGRVWVKPTVAVLQGEKAYADEATGELTNVATAFPVGSFKSAAQAGEVAILDVEIV